MANTGLDAKFYYGTAGSTAANELSIVSNDSPDLTAEEVESKYRDGWVSTDPGSFNLSINVTVKTDGSNAGYAALVAAATGRSLIAVKTINKTSGVGWDADFAVTQVSDPHELGSPNETTFNLKVNTTNRTPTRITA